MSEEKECKCCHEWWYASDIKQDLCPNCYDYFKQLKQQLAEKDKEIAHLKEKDNYHLRYELAGADETITNLKQQLEEKDKEIEKLKQQYTILENENGKLTTDLIMDKYKKAQKEVSFGKQLAIQELSEIERLLYESHYKEIDNRYYAEYEDIKNLIDSRIQALEELKGEKDVED